MPKLDKDPCPVSVPYATGNVIHNGERLCRRRDFAVWLEADAIAAARTAEIPDERADRQDIMRAMGGGGPIKTEPLRDIAMRAKTKRGRRDHSPF